MDYSQLDSFMKIKKKSDASQLNKSGYQEEMFNLFGTEGYSDNAEKYLFDGFTLGGIDAFVKFLNTKTFTEKEALYQEFISGKMFVKNNKGISFKLMTALIVCLINENNQDLGIIRDIIIRLNGLSKNSKGERHGDITKTIEKYFIRNLATDAVLPDFTLMDLKPATLNGFISLIGEAFNGIKLSDPKDIVKADRIVKWLGNVIAQYELPEKENIQYKGRTKKIKDVSKEDNIIKVSIENLSKFQKIISIALNFKDIVKDYTQIQEKCDYLQQENDRLYAKGERLIQELAKQEASLKESFERNESAYSEIRSLKSEIGKKDMEIKNMTDEIIKRNAVLSVYESDKKNSQQEHLNAIASKLRTEYQDFKDAVDMEMTIDLGENMRQQLSLVFKILAKNGIDIERR